METLLYRLDAAAWYANSEDLRERFTRVDSFGEEYTMYLEDPVQDLIGLPRTLGAPEIAQTKQFAYSDGYQWADGFVPRDDEQGRMVADAAYILKQKLGTIMQAPTGYGKTYLGAAVVQRLGQKTCVITTKEDIMHDWRKALSEVLSIPESDVHFWNGDNVPGEDAQAVVALVQSVAKGPERYSQEMYDQFGFVIVDEVQRMGADYFSQAMWWFKARYRLGLSATPYRRDGRERVFKAHIGEVDVWTEEQVLPFKVIMCRTGWKAPKLWHWNPATKKQEFGPLPIPWGRAIVAVKHLQEHEYRNDLIFKFCKSALKKKRNTVIFSDTVEHLDTIKEHLIANGIGEENFGYYVGLTNKVYNRPKKEQYKDYRKDLRDQAATKPFVLATYKMCSEGTNKPWWDTAVFATAKADVNQIMGRIRREYEGKNQPVALDLVDDHQVFHVFAKKRIKWYEHEGAEIVHR